MRLLFFNLHGLIRKEQWEIGRDADNGGQIAYVMELAHELSRHPDVSQIDLFTRLIDDPTCSDDYAQPLERVNEKFNIRRISCGGNRYLQKEKLWPHLDEFVANSLQLIRKEKLQYDWMHAHYADAGYAAAELSEMLDIPFAFTSHSLGRIKLERMKSAGLDEKALALFNFGSRIPAEERAMLFSEFTVTSTRQERDSYSAYDAYAQTDYEVIPPGTDLTRFSPYLSESMTMGGEIAPPQELRARVRIQEELERFLTHPEKPIILALCRPDKRKNIEGVVEAYGKDKELQAIANLAIFAGIRKDIRSMGEAEKSVLTELLLMMDAYDLYGKIAIPKQLNISWEVPEIYRIAARKRGVFVNAAFVEPFGLTILEAAASGLPVVATKYGGPSEIFDRLDHGLLVDPRDPAEISSQLKKILTDNELWSNFSFNGMERVKEHYSWKAHANRYLEQVDSVLKETGGAGAKQSVKAGGVYSRMRSVKRMLVCDLDGTLVDHGGENGGLDELREWLEQRDEGTVFGYATGRNPELIRELAEEYNLPRPDFAIHSVGTGILFDPLGKGQPDRGWERHIEKQWRAERIAELLKPVEWLTPQEESVQNRSKVSWVVEEGRYDPEELRERLGGYWYRSNVIFSHERLLDILPKRASKGRAIRHMAGKWGVPLSQIIACGDSGNDLDMFTGAIRGVVVSGYFGELEMLKQTKRIYFAPSKAASGVVEGLRHFGWIK